MNTTVKKEVEDWLTTIDLHLEAAEDAIQKNNSTLAEAEVFAARDKLRHVKATAARISN
jgi:hypothetical protein